MTNKSYDIAIVGGGIAGCACGIAIKRLLPELDICIVDRSGQTDDYTTSIRPRIGETLPPQISIPMQQLGLWELFKQANWVKSAGTQAAWGQATPHVNEYIYSPYGNGWHLDRQQFDAMLLTQVKLLDVQVLNKVQITGVHQQDSGWRLQLRTQSSRNEPNPANTLIAKFIVDATGRNTAVAQRLGIGKQVFDHLVGIYQFYSPNKRTPTQTDSSTLIESVNNGWWYSANLPEQQQVVALMTDADLARSASYRKTEAFNQALQSTRLITSRLSGYHAANSPIITAAHTQCLKQLAGPGWLAVGDAAFTYDPLSSLGIFKALRMSLTASFAIKDYFNGKDRELKKYCWFGDNEFKSYLNKRRDYYAEETRFTDNPFWQRRIAA